MRKPLMVSTVATVAVGALVAVALLAGGVFTDADPSGEGDADPAGKSAVVGDAAEAGPENYVALGDSFVAGPGIAPQRPGACARSEANFASLVASGLGVDDFVDASCGGATTADLFKPQAEFGEEVNDPQLDALSADTTLITFGMLGGNDMGLVRLAASCVTGACGPDAPGGTAVTRGIETARTNVVRGLREAKERSPRAEILVIGYGTYLPPGGCARLSGITPDEADYLQGMIDRLSDMLGEVAAREQVGFVDMRTIPGVGDHTVCAAPEKQWIRAIETWGDGAMFHPSSCGMDASAQHVRNALRIRRGKEPVAFDASCRGAGPSD